MSATVIWDSISLIKVIIHYFISYDITNTLVYDRLEWYYRVLLIHSSYFTLKHTLKHTLKQCTFGVISFLLFQH